MIIILLTAKEAGVCSKLRLDVAVADGRSEFHDERDGSKDHRAEPSVHLIPHPSTPAGALLPIGQQLNSQVLLSGFHSS